MHTLIQLWRQQFIQPRNINHAITAQKVLKPVCGHHHSRSDKCHQQTAEVTHSVFVKAYHSHKSKIRGVPGNFLWEFLPKQVPSQSKSNCTLFAGHDHRGEPTEFQYCKYPIDEDVQQQGMIKRIECLSHIQKCSRNNLSST